MISPRYLLIEVLMGVLYAFTAVRLGTTEVLPAVFAAEATLVALAVIDIERLILPKRIVFSGLALVLVLLVGAAILESAWGRLESAAVYAMAWYLLFFLINLAAPRALGFGDVRLSLLLGAVLGWFGWRYVVVGFFTANLLGAVLGVVLIATGKLSRSQPIPYGVFLAAGTIGTLLAGPIGVSWLAGVR